MVRSFRLFCENVVLARAAALLIGLAPVPALHAAEGDSWRPVWSVSPASATATAPLYAGQTIRQIVHASAAGSTLRLRLSQRYGLDPVPLTAVSIGLRAEGAAIRPGSLRPVTFGGSRAVGLAAGQTRYSDPIALNIAQFEDLVISYTVTRYVGQATGHPIARERSYNSVAAQAADQTSASSYLRSSSGNAVAYVLIEAVEAQTTTATRTLVAVGDSLTDGFVSQLGTTLIPETARLGLNERYPDYLARRLAMRYPGQFTVVNAGISGNRINAAGQVADYGPSLLSRLDADVAEVPGVTDVILQEGINDLGISSSSANADAVIAGLSQAVTRLRASDLRVWLGTLMPARGKSAGLKGGVYSTAAVEQARQKVNTWIRGQQLADGVVDFDACTRDPADPASLNPAFDSGDHLHPNADGYRAMADCVDLEQLR